MRISKITIGRLYNLGSYEHIRYEHIRYELTLEVPESESASLAILGLEKIIEALNPKTSTNTRGELDREHLNLTEKRNRLSLSEDEFRRHYGHFVGTPAEYVERCELSHAENVKRRNAWEARSEKARKMLDDLGGAANWKDAKLEWENDGDF